jgi:hypothetical protein
MKLALILKFAQLPHYRQKSNSPKKGVLTYYAGKTEYNADILLQANLPDSQTKSFQSVTQQNDSLQLNKQSK